MSVKEVAYLGPPGTYSHLVAVKRFGSRCRMVPYPTIHDICSFVSGRADRSGVVPIENSSGGAIYETVDILLENHPRIHIVDELTLNVILSLLGRENEEIRTLYSHFAPMEHCAGWIKKNLPNVQKQVVASTAIAAVRAASEGGAAALGSRRLANMYNLKVLKYPVKTDMPNITMFLTIAGKKGKIASTDKTTLAAKLPNVPGSLCTFLEAFRDRNVNLSRLISRPIRGCPREYAFLVDLAGGIHLKQVKAAIAAARKGAVEVRIVGSYPCRRPYTS